MALVIEADLLVVLSYLAVYLLLEIAAQQVS